MAWRPEAPETRDRLVQRSAASRAAPPRQRSAEARAAGGSSHAQRAAATPGLPVELLLRRTEHLAPPGTREDAEADGLPEIPDSAQAFQGARSSATARTRSRGWSRPGLRTPAAGFAGIISASKARARTHRATLSASPAWLWP
jgi:hypothetical protein